MSLNLSRPGAGERPVIRPLGHMGSTKIEKAQRPRQALVRLALYLKPYRAGLTAVLVSVLLYTFLGLLGPYLMGVAIDQFIAGRDAARLVQIAIVMLVVYLLNNGFQAIANWIMAIISQRALQNLRRDLFEHIQELSLSFF
jgi:ATP-binding cassette subfamily B protein